MFVEIRRGIFQEGYQTSYHVRKKKKWQWLICLYVTLGEMSAEIEVYADENAMLNLRNQDFSKEI